MRLPARMASILLLAGVTFGSNPGSVPALAAGPHGPARGAQPDASRARGARRVVAVRSPRLAARVISTRPAFRLDPDTSAQSPAITSGSGVCIAGWWLFVAQDDSSLVAAKGPDGSFESLRVFPSVGGSDRFTEAAGTKGLKPDLEAALTVAVPAAIARRIGAPPVQDRPTLEAVLLVGSGSKEVHRDRMALIFPAQDLADSTVVTVHASRFYETMRREPTLAGQDGDFNVEGVALVGRGRFLRFYNRGNGRPGSVVGSVDLPLEPFLDYLARASADSAASFGVPITRRCSYDLGRTSDGNWIGITDAITLPPLAGAPPGMEGEIRVFSAIAEHTATAIADGYTSDSSICLELPDGRLLIAPATGVANAASLKIEGLSVVTARWIGRPAQLEINLVAVTDADSPDPGTPSTLARVEVTFRPSARAATEAPSPPVKPARR